MKKVTTLFLALLYSVNLAAQDMPLDPSWQVPEGWEYVLNIGPPDIFHLYDVHGGDSSVMEVYSHRNAAILAKNIAMPLKDDTAISWDWRVDSIPSPVAENTAETHDYLSVAVLFDNGQDLSYVWSREIPQGTSFRCPLPDWTHRETHLIIRSGEDELFHWLSEARNLKADYQRYIGGELPQNISQVWLITNSIFQGGTAKATVRDITIESKKNRYNEEVL